MYKSYIDYKKFFEFLYKKPKNIYQETDIILSNSKSENKNEGNIYYTNEIRNIFNTKIFKRINKIFQLGTEIFIQNSLMHTRGEHSKGTYELTLELMMSLCQKEEIKELIEKKHYEKYVLAELIRALLHDIGHGPFSHTMETVCNLPKGFHEEIGKRMIAENEELKEALNKIYPNMPQLLREVEEKNFLGLNSLFEGQFDVDRADFITRDNFFAGRSPKDMVKIALELLQNVDIKKISVNGKNKIIPIFKGSQLQELETFLSCRFNNYKNLYYGNQGKLYEYIFKEFADCLLESNEDYDLKTFLQNNRNKKPEDIDLEEYIRYNDIEFFRGIMEVYENTENEKLKQLAKLCIPNKFMVPSIYYGLMTQENGNNEEEKTKIDTENEELIAKICKIDNEDIKELLEDNFKLISFNNEKDLEKFITKIKNVLKIESDEVLERYGILKSCSKNYLYKNKPGEEIYISDEEGKIYTYDKFPSRRKSLAKFANTIIILDCFKLKEFVTDEKDIKQVIYLFTQEQSQEQSQGQEQ